VARGEALRGESAQLLGLGKDCPNWNCSPRPTTKADVASRGKPGNRPPTRAAGCGHRMKIYRDAPSSARRLMNACGLCEGLCYFRRGRGTGKEFFAVVCMS